MKAWKHGIGVMIGSFSLGAHGCIVVAPPSSPMCTATLENRASGTTIGQVAGYYSGRPFDGTEYIDAAIGPGTSYSFTAYADRGEMYLCPKRVAGSGCLSDLYVENPQPGGVHAVTLTDQNCYSCR